MIVVIMGVSGCGKTSVAKAIAKRQAMTYVEGDEFHPPDNVNKMSSGVPLTEADRVPWLKGLRQRIDQALRDDENLVVTCSALSRQSRDLLGVGQLPIELVFLNGSREVIAKRLSAREGHYMPPELLTSQFETLVPPKPEQAHFIDIDASLDDVIKRVEQVLNEASNRGSDT